MTARESRESQLINMNDFKLKRPTCAGLLKWRGSFMKQISHVPFLA